MTKFTPGSYNAICDRCGYKFKATKMRMTWDNLFVCESCWEPRQPQDFVRSRVDKQSVPIARPEGTDVIRANFTQYSEELHVGLDGWQEYECCADAQADASDNAIISVWPGEYSGSDNVIANPNGSLFVRGRGDQSDDVIIDVGVASTGAVHASGSSGSTLVVENMKLNTYRTDQGAVMVVGGAGDVYINKCIFNGFDSSSYDIWFVNDTTPYTGNIYASNCQFRGDVSLSNIYDLETTNTGIVSVTKAYLYENSPPTEWTYGSSTRNADVLDYSLSTSGGYGPDSGNLLINEKLTGIEDWG